MRLLLRVTLELQTSSAGRCSQQLWTPNIGGETLGKVYTEYLSAGPETAPLAPLTRLSFTFGRLTHHRMEAQTKNTPAKGMSNSCGVDYLVGWMGHRTVDAGRSQLQTEEPRRFCHGFAVWHLSSRPQ